MATQFSTGSGLGEDSMVVVIRTVDFRKRVYTGWNQLTGSVPVHSQVLPGGVYSIPAVGEQWVVRRMGLSWFLESKTNFLDPKTALPPAEGLTALGSTGPTYLVGSEIRLPSSIFLGEWELRIDPDSGNLQKRREGETTWTTIT